MITKRPAGERGSTRTGWLDSRHTLSFNRYHDPRFKGFGDLLVINEDFVAPAGGFGTHGHSEFNHSQQEPVHFLQIRITPERESLASGYEQREFSEEERRGRLRLVASRGCRDASVTIHQDAEVYAASLGVGEEVTYEPRAGRRAWVQLIKGALELNGVELRAGDGASVSDEPRLVLRAGEPSELLLFDLA
jgi:redox-sensitive bicupin YhaK (pirin superfamily)